MSANDKKSTLLIIEDDDNATGASGNDGTIVDGVNTNDIDLLEEAMREEIDQELYKVYINPDNTDKGLKELENELKLIEKQNAWITEDDIDFMEEFSEEILVLNSRLATDEKSSTIKPFSNLSPYATEFKFTPTDRPLLQSLSKEDISNQEITDVKYDGTQLDTDARALVAELRTEVRILERQQSWITDDGIKSEDEIKMDELERLEEIEDLKIVINDTEASIYSSGK